MSIPSRLMSGLDRAAFSVLRRLGYGARYFGMNRRIFAKWAPESRFLVRVPGCGRMWLNKVDAINLYLYYFRVWEPAITRLISGYLRPGDVFVDVGANIGYYTLLASNLVGPAGRVISIEASPSIFSTLVRHVSINRCANVEPCNIAISERAGTMEIFHGSRWNVGSTSLFEGEGKSSEGYIQAQSLDELLDGRDLERIRCVKIDVEGAELQAVRGLRKVLPKLPMECKFFLEASREQLKKQSATISMVLEPFLSLGFQAYRIENRYDFDFYDRPSSEYVSPVKIPEVDEERLIDLLITKDLGVVPMRSDRIEDGQRQRSSAQG